MGGSDGFPVAPEFGPAPQYPIESVDNALRVLMLIGERPGVRLMEVSRYLGVASSTAHRVLAMLAYRGFVRQDPGTRGWLTGPMLDQVALGVLRRLDVRVVARPVLERLAAHLGETVHLGRLEGREVYFLDSIESERSLRVGGRLGRAMPAHCTSNGKAMLATLTEAELLDLFPDEELLRLTSHSIGSRTQLLEALERVRAHGFATSDEESEEGVASIGVTLRVTPSERLAITASAPVSRMSEPVRAEMLAQLREAAEEIDKLLP